MDNRLNQQIQFILEIDKLKNILRQIRLTNNERMENSAEHSWHLAIMAIILAEYAPPNVDLLKAIKMLLIHDLVEIDAGDTFCYDQEGNQHKTTKEQKAANRIFGLLPPEQAQQFQELWQEFEAFETPTAKFSVALDRLQPLLMNQHNEGETWQRFDITLAQVRERMNPVKETSGELWDLVENIIENCLTLGYLTG